jgi:hypothetical protein
MASRDSGLVRWSDWLLPHYSTTPPLNYQTSPIHTTRRQSPPAAADGSALDGPDAALVGVLFQERLEDDLVE